jgi:predicted CxxxxCH...CXXCH cytochrome family protein
VNDGQSCDSCHGGGGIAAPPRDLLGNTARTARGVGAHREHLAASTWRREVFCSSCHVVPTEVSSPGHLDGDNRAEIPFDALNPAASYDLAAGRCDNLYCHGNGRASVGTMVWADDVTITCTSCHAMTGGGATGLQGDHKKHFDKGYDCVDCHQQVIGAGRVIVAPALHVDGLREVSILTGGSYAPATRRCTNLACHGDETW